MISFFKKTKNQNKKIMAAADGTSIALEQVNDPAFASKALGDGIAVMPTGHVVVAPCDGTLSMVAATRHAFGLTCEDGLELMVHIGIDSVGLNGEGFTVLEEEGTKVKAGQPIVEFDPQVMAEKAIDMTTMTIMLNGNDFEVKETYCGTSVSGGTDVVLEYC